MIVYKAANEKYYTTHSRRKKSERMRTGARKKEKRSRMYCAREMRIELYI